MALQIAGQVQKGVLPNLSSGSSSQPIAQGQFGEALVSEVSARYANLVLSGQVFGVTYTAGATAAASATATGLFSLFNPPNSGKNLILLDAVVTLGTFALVTTAAEVAGLVIVPNQTPTAQTPGNTPVNMLGGSGNLSVAKPLTAGTLVGAPVVASRVIASFFVGTAVGVTVASYKDEIAGAVIISPGSLVDIVSIASTPTIIPSLTWAEIPV